MKTIIAVLFVSVFCTGAQTASHPPAHKTNSSASSQKPGSAAAQNSRQPSTEMVNQFLQQWFGYVPNMKWDVTAVKPVEGVPGITEVSVRLGEPPQLASFYVTSDLHHAFIGNIIPFGSDPFGPARRKLAEQAKGPVQGNATAPVEIVEFSDFECPHCKRAQPMLEKLMSESPNARLVFEQFPLSSIHKWADLAAGYSDCIGRKSPEQFWKFNREVFDQQEQITEENAAAKLSAIAGDAGANPSATATCATSPDTKARIIQQSELGKSLGITGTPTLFINGRKIDNVNGTPYEVLREMITFEAQQAKR